MPIQIKFTKDDSNMGYIAGVLRIKGKKIYFKSKHSGYTDGMIAKLQTGGAVVTRGNGNWIRIDILRDLDWVKLGGEPFNPKELSENEIELILANYFQVQYARAGFKIKTDKK